MSLMQLSVSGGAVILFALIVRGLFFCRLPKGTFFALWVVATLRLLLPVSIPLPALIPVSGQTLGQGSSRLPVEGNLTALLGQGAQREPFPVLTALWLAGVLLLALYFGRAYWQGMQVFRVSLPDDSPEIQSWLAGHSLRRPLAVRRSDQIASPLTYGVLRPVILLPKEWKGEADALDGVLTHEYVHVRRFDAATKLLFAAALCLHWFNPLVWVLYRMGSRDMELSCDAQVLRWLGKDRRAGYARTLLDLEEARSGFPAVYSHFSQNAITERIESIMKYKKSSVAAVVLGLTLVVGATAAFASAPKEVPQDAPPLEGVICDNENLPYHEEINIQEETRDGSWEMEQVQELTASQQAVSQEKDTGTDWEEMPSTLISVSHDDEVKFTPEEWADILEQIGQGNIFWED